MGRNPAVGRQGPRHHAAVIPSEDTAKALEVKQIRSTIGHPETMRRTLAALGEGTVVADGALVVAQHLTKRAPADTAGMLRAFRTRRFGETTLTFFRAGGYDAQTPAPERG